MKNKFLYTFIALTALLCTGIPADAFAQTDIPDYSEYILTPPAPDSPRINGARIFGVRPGSEFRYTIPATGIRPMKFAAEGLPKGLKVDPETGIITGKVKKAGEYNVVLVATNSLGADRRNLKIVVGDEIALTPPLGWNSWNCWGNSVSQENVLHSAQAMVDKGLVDYGWSYINIDDGWQALRGGKYNAIQPNAKFPDMKGLADDIHAMGLKLGIYSGPWVGTYAGHIGSYSDTPDGTYEWAEKGICTEYYRYVKPDDPKRLARREHYYHGLYSWVEADAKQWRDWDIDYLKYDWNPNDYYYTKEMHDALLKLDRDIVYSLSNSAPYADAPVWMEYSNCWRTTGDIRDTWKSMSDIGFAQDRWIAFNRPGHWADADMMVLGMVGWGPNLHYTQLTPDEQYTHVSLWSLLASPMLLGCALERIDDFTLSLLCNHEVLDIHQDPLGIQAFPIVNKGNEVIYVKHLEDGSMAVGFFNRGEESVEMSITPRQLGMRGVQTVRDVWRQKDVGRCNGRDDKFETTVAPHGVRLVKFYPGNSKEAAPKFPQGK